MRSLSFVLLFTGWLALQAPAGVVVTKLENPMQLYPALGNAMPLIDVDFNQDGIVDFRFAPGRTGIGGYVYGDTRVLILFDRNPGDIGGYVGGLPLNYWLGETNYLSGYRWYEGGILPSLDHKIFGDRVFTIMTVFAIPIGNHPPLAIAADIRYQNCAVGVEFLIGTNKHYGYVHVDMRQEHDYLLGIGGYIYGWAYETEPGKPVLTAPIAVPAVPARCQIVNLHDGGFNVCWRGTIGGL